MEIRESVPLAPLTYYKIGGPARYYAQPAGVDDLRAVSDFLRRTGLPYLVLGAGSNVLVDDQGFDGLVLHTSALDRTLTRDDDAITAGASVMVIQLLRLCMAEGIAGMERLVGIPGNMGGVFAMNAGTRLGEIKDVVEMIDVYDLASGRERRLEREALKYSYRRNHFLDPHEIIVRGRVRGLLSAPKQVQDEVQSLLASRKKSQPIDKPSCGSVFRNPDPSRGLHAWKVVADCGLRGQRVGNAQISDLHTNFIVNLGGATAADVKALIAEAKSRARTRFGVELEEEVRVLDHQGQNRL